MSASCVYDENYHCQSENDSNHSQLRRQKSSRQSLKAKFDREFKLNGNTGGGKGTGDGLTQLSRSNCSGWCDALSITLPNVNAKQAWKNGTEKLSHTINTVRTTFGTLSQKIKKSTRRRQPLINLDSPMPVTPHTKSKELLGRTPTKLYSPFDIDTPKQKENVFGRPSKTKSPGKGANKSLKRRLRKAMGDPGVIRTQSIPSETKLSNDLLQTQLGIYEFQSVANRIVQM